MGAQESEKAIAQQKIDEDGMSSDSDFDGCRGRLCSSSRRHILRDVLRGFLVLTVLGIIVTVIFLLCFFLIQEKQDDKLIDELVNEFSFDDEPHSDFSIGSQSNPSNEAGPTRGDLGKERDKLLDGRDQGQPNGGPLQPPPHQMENNRQDIEGRLPDRRPAPVDINRPFRNEYSEPSGLTPEDEAFLAFNDFVPVDVQNTPLEEVVKAEEEMVKSLHGELPEALPGLEFEFEKMPPPVIVTSEKQCEELRLPLCSGSMPWAMTSFPNWVNNTNRRHLQESLSYFQSVIVGSQCSPRGLEYSCAILEPPCGPDEVPLPPCRQFCLDVTSSCREFLVEGHSHNGVFECSVFPDSDDPTVCVNVKRAENIPLGEAPADQVPQQDSVDTDIQLEGQKETGPQFEDYEEPMICDHSLFLCQDGSDCFTYDKVCNGIQECLDNSDEHNCTVAPAEIDIQNEPLNPNEVQPNTRSKTSLSEMLSSSAIVSSPQLESEPESNKRNSNPVRAIPRRLSAIRSPKKPKDLVPVPSQDTISTLDKSKTNMITEPDNKSKMTLADLLSSSVAPRSPQKAQSDSSPIEVSQTSEIDSTPNAHTPSEVESAQNLSVPPQRTLSHILSSSIPTFSSKTLEGLR